jgi:transcriptional regulator GlxA family with amidase domain
MKNVLKALILFFISAHHFNCHTDRPAIMTKAINTALPTIGILIFEEFLANEVVAPLDVFTKTDSTGKTLFNVVLVAKEDKIYLSEEGLKVLPDFTIRNVPHLNILVVPSSNHPEKQINDQDLIDFIKDQNKSTDYIASHCAGAFMLGESGVADNRKIVTYLSGADKLQKAYPKLLVMDDNIVSVVKDGKIISSNGSLVSYLASLDLLELMTSPAHRKYVEEQLLINKLKE